MEDYCRRILRLKNPIMEYDWGSKTFIPELLGLPCPAPAPAAELWMGAHPRAPSRAQIAGGEVPLDRLIRDNPEGALGRRALERFGVKLPFLLKVLAVERPLSIQAHPDREQARAGYRREEYAGIPVDSPSRNYRDPEPKPELICALTPFEALCGFREPNEIAAFISGLAPARLWPEAAGFLDDPGEDRLRLLFGSLLALPETEINTLIARLAELAGGKGKAPAVPAAVRDLVLRLLDLHPDDPGALAPLFLNLVRIRPGEAVFLAPGVLHAYLRGAGMEIMAGSDNVLRGGLTAKHVDGGELADILSCRCGSVAPGGAESGEGGECVYRSPAEEYQLSRIIPGPGVSFQSGRRRGPEIIFCYRGRAAAEGNARPPVELARGDSIFIPFGAGEYSLSGEATLFRAALPPREGDS